MRGGCALPAAINQSSYSGELLPSVLQLSDTVVGAVEQTTAPRVMASCSTNSLVYTFKLEDV